MYKIAVIGDKDSVLAFRALGVHVFTAIEGNEARRIIDKLAKEELFILLSNWQKIFPKLFKDITMKLFQQ